MEIQEFKVIYDILQEGYFGISWGSILWFLGVFFASVLIFAVSRNSKFKKFGGYFLPIICSILLLVGVWSIYRSIEKQMTCLDWVKTNNFQMVEGKIKELRSDFKSESFSVEGVNFRYGEYDLTKCGYRQAKGIKLENEKLVRITYHDGCILKLEVAE